MLPEPIGATGPTGLQVTAIIERMIERWVCGRSGTNGQPTREPFRPVDPSIPVLVDLASMYPTQPRARTGGYNPAGCNSTGQFTATYECGDSAKSADGTGWSTYGITHAQTGTHKRRLKSKVRDCAVPLPPWGRTTRYELASRLSASLALGEARWRGSSSCLRLRRRPVH